MSTNVRVRFAPSPTGPFSIGNARTALFNWLFAKHEKGEFFLRIEDTDKERSKKKYEKEIIDGLTWLGLAWDGEISRQSEREPIYKNYLEKLLNDRHAYWCFCSASELEIERQAQLSQGLPPRYSGRCRNLPHEETVKRLKKESAIIRFKTPEKIVAFNDLVRGHVEVNSALLGDMVIAKSLTEPLYNFAVVIDDYEMKISHVIRGEDHLPNTPKQILIQEVLSLPTPIYAHLPLILGPDRKKLSKRYLDYSLTDYEKDGYLAQAMLNFLVLMGWHPEKDREILTVSEMINEFSLKRVQKSGAIFNPQKLDWLNGTALRAITGGELVTALKPFLPKDWLKDNNFLEKVVNLTKDRVKKLGDFKTLAEFFFELPKYPKELLIWKETAPEITAENLKFVLRIIENLSTDKFIKIDIELHF